MDMLAFAVSGDGTSFNCACISVLDRRHGDYLLACVVQAQVPTPCLRVCVCIHRLRGLCVADLQSLLGLKELEVST